MKCFINGPPFSYAAKLDTVTIQLLIQRQHYLKGRERDTTTTKSANIRTFQTNEPFIFVDGGYFLINSGCFKDDFLQ